MGPNRAVMVLARFVHTPVANLKDLSFDYRAIQEIQRNKPVFVHFDARLYHACSAVESCVHTGTRRLDAQTSVPVFIHKLTLCARSRHA